MTIRPGPPRKVVVGACIYPMYASVRPYAGVRERLEELSGLIDGMAQRAGAMGRSLDLAVLPETAVNGGRQGSAVEISEPLDGPVLERMGEVARRHATWVVVPLFLAETDGSCSNACVLLNRRGEVAGIYRKVFPVAARGESELEGGVTPGNEFPVFDCDFGKLGLQICFDAAYDDGWLTLAAGGAELIAWPTMSPQTVRPASLARQHAMWIVSSNWRNNATVFEPTGMQAAQIVEPETLLVHEIDLAWAILPWQPPLRNGALFDETYGDRAGYHYSEAEDGGLFWSNDPDTPVTSMVEHLDLETVPQVVERNRALQDQLRPA